MIEGIVKWFNDEHGHGFIRSSAIESPIFVHYSAIQVPGHKTLIAGQRVYFELTNGLNGPKAINVCTEEVYAIRRQICGKSTPLTINTLVKDTQFLAEIEKAFYQLPNRLSPGREWAMEQLRGFEPASSRSGEVKEEHIQALANYVSKLQTEFIKKKSDIEQQISKIEQALELQRIEKEDDLKLIRRLAARVRSLNSNRNKEQALRVFEVVESDIHSCRRKNHLE